VSDLNLGPIAEIAATQPTGIALVDGLSTRTWADTAVELRQVASAMLAGAPDPQCRDCILFRELARLGPARAGGTPHIGGLGR